MAARRKDPPGRSTAPTVSSQPQQVVRDVLRQKGVEQQFMLSEVDAILMNNDPYYTNPGVPNQYLTNLAIGFIEWFTVAACEVARVQGESLRTPHFFSVAQSDEEWQKAAVEVMSLQRDYQTDLYLTYTHEKMILERKRAQRPAITGAAAGQQR